MNACLCFKSRPLSSKPPNLTIIIINPSPSVDGESVIARKQGTDLLVNIATLWMRFQTAAKLRKSALQL